MKNLIQILKDFEMQLCCGHFSGLTNLQLASVNTEKLNEEEKMNEKQRDVPTIQFAVFL